MKTSKIVVVDEHPLFREALCGALETCFSKRCATEMAAPQDVSDVLDKDDASALVLFGMALPGSQGLTQLAKLRERFPQARLVAMAPQQDPSTIRCCMELGVAGVIPKSLSAEAITDAVTRVLEGESWVPPDLEFDESEEDDIADLNDRLATLTPQQVRVLAMLSEGLLNKQIAYQLGVSEATVKAHVSAILQKLDVNSRTQAVIAVNRLENRDWQNVPA